MKVFASIATIFLPLQAVSGIFGMNMLVPWQGVDTLYAFFGVIAFMAGMSAFLIVYLRRKDFI